MYHYCSLSLHNVVNYKSMVKRQVIKLCMKQNIIDSLLQILSYEKVKKNYVRPTNNEHQQNYTQYKYIAQNQTSILITPRGKRSGTTEVIATHNFKRSYKSILLLPDLLIKINNSVGV